MLNHGVSDSDPIQEILVTGARVSSLRWSSRVCRSLGKELDRELFSQPYKLKTSYLKGFLSNSQFLASMPPDICPWPCPKPTRATLNIHKAVCKLSSNLCLQFRESSVSILLPSQGLHLFFKTTPLSWTNWSPISSFSKASRNRPGVSIIRPFPRSPSWWTEMRNHVLIKNCQPVSWAFLQAAFPQCPKTPQSSLAVSHAIIFKSYSNRICIAALLLGPNTHMISSVPAGTVVISDFLQPVSSVQVLHFPLALQLFVVNTESWWDWGTPC